MPRASAEQRFQAKVIEHENGCWLWTATTNRDGYGSFWGGAYRNDDPAQGPIMVLAHRWSYEHYVGKVPAGLNVLHSCDTPSCVNPKHLFTGTQAENVEDCARKGRRNQRRFRKLNAEIHDLIRTRYAIGNISQGALAAEYGVTQVAISRIVRADPFHRALSLAERGARRHALAATIKYEGPLAPMGLAFVHHPECPNPDPVADCDCQANAHCRTCGWAKGAIPCLCRPTNHGESAKGR